MEILITAPTQLEIAPLLGFGFRKKTANCYTKSETGKDFTILITGVGIAHTCISLSTVLAQQTYDTVYNIGVAGAYSKNLQLTEVVEVTQDCFADFGIDNRGVFEPIHQHDFFQPHYTITTTGHLQNSPRTTLAQVRSNTVHTCTGSDAQATRILQHFPADIESMEGAAFFATCQHFNQKAVQVRSISNYVENRQAKNWQLHEAIESLNLYLVDHLKITK